MVLDEKMTEGNVHGGGDVIEAVAPRAQELRPPRSVHVELTVGMHVFPGQVLQVSVS